MYKGYLINMKKNDLDRLLFKQKKVYRSKKWYAKQYEKAIKLLSSINQEEIF